MAAEHKRQRAKLFDEIANEIAKRERRRSLDLEDIAEKAPLQEAFNAEHVRDNPHTLIPRMPSSAIVNPEACETTETENTPEATEEADLLTHGCQTRESAWEAAKFQLITIRNSLQQPKLSDQEINTRLNEAHRIYQPLIVDIMRIPGAFKDLQEISQELHAVKIKPIANTLEQLPMCTGHYGKQPFHANTQDTSSEVYAVAPAA